MTGRAAGYCAGYAVPGSANPAYGYGRRGGRRGWGRGFGRGWYANPPVAVVPPVAQQQLPEQEVAALETYQKNLTTEKAQLEQELEGIKARLNELKSKTEK